MTSKVEGIYSLFIIRVTCKNGTEWEILQCHLELKFYSVGDLNYLFRAPYILMGFK